MARERTGRIILIRHGETDANRQRCFCSSAAIPLNETGCGQARDLADQLAKSLRPAIVFSSEFRRARETAEIIARVLKVRSETIRGIQEREFGELSGQPYERMGEMMLRADEDEWRWRPPRGESLEDVQLRAIAALHIIGSRRPEQDVVAVSHGAVIQAICAHVTGEWREPVLLPNCGTCVVECSDAGWRFVETL